MDVISFFTGGGFMDIGFEQAGFNVVWTNEYDENIADMYEHGMTSLRWSARLHPAPCNNFCGEGAKTLPMARISSRKSIADLTAWEVMEYAKPGKLFGVIGGPPCPDFSIGGKQAGRDGERGQLSGRYVDMIVALKPNWFVMENVPGLVETKPHRAYLDDLRRVLSKNGYVTDVKILSALNLGIPQDRRRMFMVGFLENGLKEKPASTWGIQADGWFPFPKETYPDAKTKYPWPDKDPFQPYVARPEPKGIPLELTVCPLLMGAERACNGLEFFQPKSDKFDKIEEGDVNRKSYKRLHCYRYSPTVAYGNNEVHFHPWLPRRLSVREALRIQTVPDEYVLPRDKPLSKKFKMISNGVPCLLGLRIAQSIKEFCNRNIS